MKKTRVCNLLGIESPIIQGGMVWIANAELAAAVSEAGGLGLISPTAKMSHNGDQVDNLKGQIKTARNLTSKPFGVNLPILHNPQIEDLIAAGDKVIVRFIYRGTHEGEFLGVPATGNKVEMGGIIITRIENGKIIEDRDESDMLGFMQQLGMELKPKEKE